MTLESRLGPGDIVLVRGDDNRPVTLGAVEGRGANSVVYNVDGDSHVLVKIYRRPECVPSELGALVGRFQQAFSKAGGYDPFIVFVGYPIDYVGLPGGASVVG